MTFNELATKLDEQLKLMNLKFFSYNENLVSNKTSYYYVNQEIIVVIRYTTKVVLFTDSKETKFYNVLKENEIEDNSLDLVIKAIQKVINEIKKNKIEYKLKDLEKDFE